LIPTKNIPVYRIKTKKMDPLGFDILDLSGKDGRVYDSELPHRHTFFELFLFEKGKGLHEVDFTNYAVDANSAHFVSPGQIHQLSLKNAKGFLLCFTEDFISLKTRHSFSENFPFYNNPASAVLRLNKTLAKEISMLVSALNREVKAYNADQTELVHSYLNIILLKLKSYYLQDKKNETPAGKSRAQKMTQFKKLLNDGFLKHQPVSAYASALNVSPNYLNALCKKHEGRTAIQLIQDRLLLESKRLLYATDMDIKEISFHLNFEDVSYYNRFFKKLTNLTPVQYRGQSRKNH
jgi:AraC family transcriptional regulator, transcriptional activator of pobA